jgi:hypothetical protein
VRRLPLILTLVALILAGLTLAESSSAATTVRGQQLDTASTLRICYVYNPTVRKKNRVGITLYRMQVNLRWCTRGRRIVEVSASSAWFPYVAAWCCDVVGTSNPVSRWERYNGYWHGAYYVVRQAHVKSCIPIRAYCKHYYPYIKARMLYTGKAVLWRYAG